jgi:hypothetical protein
LSIIVFFRREEPVKRPVRDNTPTLDEESSPEVIGVLRGSKKQGIFIVLYFLKKMFISKSSLASLR